MKIRTIAAVFIIALSASALTSTTALASSPIACQASEFTTPDWAKKSSESKWDRMAAEFSESQKSSGSKGSKGSKKSSGSSRSGQTCATCSGMGSTTCTWCNGTGQMSAAGMSYTCSSCLGTGKAACLGCNGTGKKKEFNNTTSSSDTGKKQQPKNEAPSTGSAGITLDTGSYFDPCAGTYGYQAGTGISCSICNGAGKRVCQSCRGNGFTETMQSSANYGYGSTPYWTKTSCAACRGTGKVPCTYCGGDGMR